MKILMLVSSMHAGGAERVAATLVNAWSARGDSVTLVPTFSSKGSCFYPVAAGVELIWLADRAGAGPLARLAALRRLIGETAPDVIVSFLTNVNVAAILANRRKPYPLIVCERTNPAILSTATPFWRALRRLLYRRADMVTVQTEATRAPFAALVPGIKRLAVIANPLPPDLAAMPAAGGEGGARLRLVAMGRLVPQKQFDLLIDAYARLAGDLPEWDLWIWGEGPDRDALQARVRGHGLDGRVFLAGRTDAPWPELRRAAAFVLSSSVEGFPNVLLEAMSLALPCVAFDCPSGPREILRGGEDGLLVPNGDAAALEAALLRLCTDPRLRGVLGARAAEGVRTRYALPTVLAQWDVLFDQVGAHSRTRQHPLSASVDNVRQGTP
jgi:GalNAc-alpha-(1->4)-GalNAc-alpha-(1->3)-diNAcBac-PP-undecaprenol alpha-1,4-N-acetyl-D-galactosaminyltransferase